MSNPTENTDILIDSARRMTAEILRKAMADYRMLESRGWVKAGVINRDILPIRHNARRRRIVCGLMSVYDVFDLIDLLYSEELRVMCDLTQLNISPLTVRAKLGLPESRPVFEGELEVRNGRSKRSKENW